jgi:DNA-binding XRE family transcriptional regulator
MDVWLRDRNRGKNPSPEQIKKTRWFAGPTLEEMAALLHVSKRTYQDWEAGRTKMHPNHWLAMRCICDAELARRQKAAAQRTDEALQRLADSSE